MLRIRSLRLVALLASGAVVAGSSPATVVVQQNAQQSRQEALCRRPAALPILPPEQVIPQLQQGGSTRAGGHSVVAPMAPPSPPSPPPPPVAAPAMSAEADISVTGSRVAAPAPAAPSAPEDSARATSEASPPPPPPTGTMVHPDRYDRQWRPQAGILTAGDYDDLLNPQLYARYVRNFLRQFQQQADFPRVDTSRALTIAVHDGSGRPVPFAPVTLACADGNRLTLQTMADGTAVFYPDLDRLGSSVRMFVAHRGSRYGDNRVISFSGQPGHQQHSVTVSGAADQVRKFDLLVAIDTTGSMGDEISYLKTELQAILDDLRRTHRGLDIRLSLIVYRDIGDEYVTRTFAFTSDLNSIQAQLAHQYVSGGGDYPEAMDQALIRAMNQQWRADAVKSLLLVADAPPHDQLVGRAWAAAEVARAKRIHIVPVAASGVADKAEYLMRAMAAATQSRYIFLTDDSGVGNPHAPPAVDCYLVTRLNRLIRRVLDSQISGRRVEPREGEMIRSVGTYDNGRCILPPDWSLDYRQ
jgi:uncharacterized protein YegL